MVFSDFFSKWAVAQPTTAAILALGLGVCGHAAAQTDRAALTGGDAAAYDLLQARCADCHAPYMFESDFESILDFDALFTNSLASGAGRFAINCAAPERSNILSMIAPGPGGEAPKMPKGRESLDADDQQILTDWIAAGCAARAAPDAAPQLQAAAPEPPSLQDRAGEALTRHCARCHTAGKSNNGGFMQIDDLAFLATGRGPKPYINACRPDESLILRQLETGAMPKDGALRGDPRHADDMTAIRAWIESLGGSIQHESFGTNRPFVSAEMLREAALRDARFAGVDAARYRYFSLATLHNANESAADLASHRRAVGKLINMLSQTPEIVSPVVVPGGGGLLLRIDLADYGWEAADWARLEEAYPYGVRPFDSAAMGPLATTVQAQTPIIRADWFAFAAARPPLYHELLNLPETEQDLEARLGLDTLFNLRSGQVVRAGFGPGESGVSFHARLIERHSLPQGGMYWKSYDFGGQSPRQNLEVTPFGPVAPSSAPNARLFEHDGGEVIFSLPNGLHGYYLATAAGARLDEGPSHIVQDSSRADRRIINGVSCMSCHSAGIQIKQDTVADQILAAGGAGALPDPRERAVLQRLHPSADSLLALFLRDEQRFLQALTPLDLAEQGPGGLLRPIFAPNSLEPVRALADRYEEGLNLLRVAAEMDMSPAAFIQAARGTAAQYFVDLSPCDRTPRATYEARYSAILPLVSPDIPARKPESEVADAAETADAAAAVDLSPVQTTPGAPVNVRVDLPKRRFDIGELFHFHVSAEQDCHFLLFVINPDGRVEVHDPSEPANQVFMGSPILRAGERRRIPISARFAARVDPPAGRQRIGAVCGVEALADMGITDYVLRYPAALGADKMTFVVRETADRFESSALDAVMVDIEVQEPE